MIQYIKVTISLILSLLAICLYLKQGGVERKYCMVGMMLSTAGDVFMTDVLKLGSIGTYPGAAFFILAHIVYACCFFRAGKKYGITLKNKGFYAGILLTVSVAVLLTVLMFLKTGTMQPMYLPLLLYLVFIGINLVSQFSFGYGKRGRCIFLIPAMTLFLISDFLVFLPMLSVRPESVGYNILIWVFYVPAQLLIILCNTDDRISQRRLEKTDQRPVH